MDLMSVTEDKSQCSIHQFIADMLYPDSESIQFVVKLNKSVDK